MEVCQVYLVCYLLFIIVVIRWNVEQSTLKVVGLELISIHLSLLFIIYAFLVVLGYVHKK